VITKMAIVMGFFTVCVGTKQQGAVPQRSKWMVPALNAGVHSMRINDEVDSFYPHCVVVCVLSYLSHSAILTSYYGCYRNLLVASIRMY